MPYLDVNRSASCPPLCRDGAGGLEHVGTGSEYGENPMFEQELVILARHHAAADDEDVCRTLYSQYLDQLRQEGLVAGRKRRDPNDMNAG
jgi:hypothetical protein